MSAPDRSSRVIRESTPNAESLSSAEETKDAESSPAKNSVFPIAGQALEQLEILSCEDTSSDTSFLSNELSVKL